MIPAYGGDAIETKRSRSRENTHVNVRSTGGESNPGESPEDRRESRGGGDAASSS